MKLHCYNDLDLKSKLGTSNTILIDDVLVTLTFKEVLNAKDIIPGCTGSRAKLVILDSWSRDCKAKASDVKEALFDLGVTVYLVDINARKILTTFLPKNA